MLGSLFFLATESPNSNLLSLNPNSGIRAAVKDADGFDFVFVVYDELTETGDQCFGSFFGFRVKTGGQ